MKPLLYCIIFCQFFLFKLDGQLLSPKEQFTNDDTLRGTLNNNRNWFNVLKYNIYVKPNIEKKSILGNVTMKFEVVRKNALMQIDLQEPLIIDSIILDNKILSFTRKNNIALINMPSLKSKEQKEITIYYHGIPRQAIRPPWDGGWIWEKDSLGRDFVSVACQGLGASVWYPCKDHQSDEPEEGAILSVELPYLPNQEKQLFAIGNGRLSSVRITKDNENGKVRIFNWVVKNPINNYNIVPYIGYYVEINDTLMGAKGKLDLQYWVLDYDREKAAKQFAQVKLMLRAFEYWFGPYPFYEDGYKLVQAPHLGMEHQSSIAYGNKFKNGYLGRDMSGTGHGLFWDYIIVHESGHEWFANNITTNDIADMWIHEGFTTYSEAIFVEYYKGKKAANEYIRGIRKGIRNLHPIIGTYNVNKEGSGDMYPKGANLIQTIRNSLGDDELFRNCLIMLNKQFYHSTTNSKDVEEFFSKTLNYNYQPVFDQYLKTIKIPNLVYKIDTLNNQLKLRWDNCIKGFNLPIFIQDKKIYVTETTSTIPIDIEKMNSILEDIQFKYYIKLQKEL